MTVAYLPGHDNCEEEIVALFDATFSTSEGPEEGRVVGTLAHDLIQTTPPTDLRVWRAEDAGRLVGCICLSRLRFAEDDRCAFILSPVAVRTGHQRQGIGQGLILHSIGRLRGEGVDYLVTYGDPAYYARSGFRPISVDDVPAPLPLSMPHGWLGQELSHRSTLPFRGPSHCVSALDRPELW